MPYQARQVLNEFTRVLVNVTTNLFKANIPPAHFQYPLLIHFSYRLIIFFFPFIGLILFARVAADCLSTMAKVLRLKSALATTR
jgi:hypothetical protein